MLYGIIADIHSNLEALQAVLGRMPKVDKLICLGDIVGYGPDPNECAEKLRKLNIPTVAGNHDKAVTEEIEITWFNRNARDAVIWTKSVIRAENRAYLEDLPLSIEEEGFHCVHGSLRSPLEEYITGIVEALPTFEIMKKPVCFIGHSHIPLFIASKSNGDYDGHILADGEEVIVGEYRKVIINVGGVGQPRDGDPRASFGTYDSKTGIFTLHRVPYDIEKVQARMRNAGLPVPLIERLSFGR